MATAADIAAAPRGAAARLRTWRGSPRSWQPEPSALTGLALATPFIVMMLVYVIYPFVRLVETAIGPPEGLHNFAIFFANKANVYVMEVTFRDAAIVTSVTFVLGALMAWSLKTTQSRSMRFAILSAIFVPFWMGSVVKIYAFSAMLGRAGLVNNILVATHVTQAPLHLLYTQVAVILGMVYQLLPYSVLPMYIAFSSIEADLILAAEGMGASRVRALLNVVLPLAVPGVLATVIIVYVISIGFFLTPVLLGGETQPFTATLIQVDLFGYFDFADASIGGLLLLAGGIAAVIVGYFLVGKERLRRAIGG